MIDSVIKWRFGEPSEVKPGMAVVYQCGKCELIGSQKHVLTGPVQRYTTLVEGFELDWIESMAAKRGL